ncbi:MAG: ACT domain-containing protein [Candidatus Diapherotrites archaeon]
MAGNESSLSSIVRTLIDLNPYTKTSLADGLVNYSALARSLKPEIEKKLGKKVKEESIVVAIKRFADEIGGKKFSNSYAHIFANSTLSMQDDMSFALIKRNDKSAKKIEELLRETDWHTGEVRIVVEGAGQIMVLLKKHRLEPLLDLIESEVMDASHQNAIVSIRQPKEAVQTYGIIAEIASKLAQKGISIEIISAPPELHFMVNEKHATEAFQTIKSLIQQAKEQMKKE